MAKDIYTVTIKVETVNEWLTKYKYNSLKQIKRDYENNGWNTSYVRKDGERYLVVENISSKEKKIFSYDSTMGMK